MKKSISATEARVHFGELLRAVAEDGATYVVERGGKPEAVVISTTEYESLIASRPRKDWLEALRESQEAFRPFVESGKMPDIVELIREEREKRDEQILNAVFGR